MSDKIKVLVVEDSTVLRILLVEILNSDARLKVMAAVASGEEAIEFLRTSQPDVVLMDIHLPEMNGYEATRQIMETRPVPIVICSATCDTADLANTFQALDAGAVALVAKPVGPAHAEFAPTTAKLLETVLLMSEVRVVKRWSRTRRHVVTGETQPTKSGEKESPVRVVAIGTSTGGPPALQTILAGLPRTFPVPILIVQHIASGFLPGLVEWLTRTTGFPTQIGVHDEMMLPGRAYLAPDGYHMGAGMGGRIVLSKHEPENGLRPSVSYLFRSLAATGGSHVLAVLLTGMGRDGAEELKALRNLGATTIAQDAESSVVHGMPGEAIKLDAAVYVLPPERIAAALTAWASEETSRDGGSQGYARR
jgi:two-component system chemotaxis response regulator CheB